MLRLDATTGLLERPQPPDHLVAVTGENYFEPAPDVREWLYEAYLDDSGPLYNVEHQHLTDANIGCLWTNAENSRHGQRIVGQAEMPPGPPRGGKWQRARSVFQLEQWFGGQIPDFLITFDALYAQGCDDIDFCSLVDHELYHCAQATDDFGMPAFNKDTGLPTFCIRGHDVEEFVGVVRRFGIEAAAGEGVAMVMAAAQPPEIGRASIGHACGTCRLKAVA